MGKTEKEAWWDGLTPMQRRELLLKVGASEAQIKEFKTRSWYQLSQWAKRKMNKMRAHEMTVTPAPVTI